MEKTLKPMSGYLALLLGLAAAVSGVMMMPKDEADANTGNVVFAIILLVLAMLIFRGIFIVNPNHSRVCILFGKYAGTVKANGLLWVNPFYQRVKVSLLAENLESGRL
jgi:regulator of protease activity HflC (stomatin/prohibitin superfamily)